MCSCYSFPMCELQYMFAADMFSVSMRRAKKIFKMWIHILEEFGVSGLNGAMNFLQEVGGASDCDAF